MTRKYKEDTHSHNGERRRFFRRFLFSTRKEKSFFRLHPLFLLTGVFYAFTGELFLFLLSALVAIQHECAHAFAAAKLGYKLDQIVLMPFGAVIDGDMKGLSFKDEIYVAACGPLCNLATALFFIAIWWITPDLYAYTDVACYASISIAAVNILPAYPLDGGRILKCALVRLFSKRQPIESAAEKIAERICRTLTLLFASALLIGFAALCFQQTYNFTLLAFGLFLLIGGLGNKDKAAIYDKIDFACHRPLAKGVEIKRVAVPQTLPIKDALKFFTKGCYLVLEVYDERQNKCFELPQNQFAELFSLAPSPYTPLKDLLSTKKG